MISLQIDYHKLISKIQTIYSILYQKPPPDNDASKLSKYAAFSTWRIEQTIIQLDSLSFSGPRTECNDAHKYIVSNIVQSWGHTELMSNHDSIPQLSWLSSFQSKLRTSNVRWFDLLLQFLSHVELLHFFHIFLLLLDGSRMILQIGGVDKIISRLELEISRQNFGI